jgi:hypothetical protein
MKRISAGYYTLEYKGQTIEVVKTYLDYSGETLWYSRINDGDAHDFCDTKKQCLADAIYLVDHADEYDIKLI